MKKNVTYIDRALFDKIIADLGVKTHENAGFTQLIFGNGYHAYVASTKTVGRVDFQFVPTTPGDDGPVTMRGVRKLGDGERFGRIVAQLDFSPESREQILSAFSEALLFAASLPAWERPKRAAISSTKAEKKEEAKLVLTPEEALKANVEEAAKRRALIERVAKEKGVTVSEKAPKLLTAQGTPASL
jgi:hypothetical protein